MMRADRVLRVRTIGVVFSISLLFIGGCSGGGGESSQTGREGQASEKPYVQIAEAKAPTAADFDLPRLEGGTFRLSDHRGQVILLDFWATWCPPCRMSIPHLIKVYEKYKGQGILVVGIALDQGGTEAVEKFVDAFKIPYPILLGNPDVVARYGNFQGIPVSFLINQQGEIVERYSGFRPRQVYETSIDLMLEEEAEADS